MDLAAVVETALTARLAARGFAAARHDLTALELPDCNGDFGCWTVSPGVCVQQGPHRDVARDLLQSDLAILLTPVTFGGYSSALKRQLDHCIPLISPRFTKVDGETHHEPRYERFPGLLAVGLLEEPDPDAAAVFERLVHRNALNMHAPRVASPILTRAELGRLEGLADGWLDGLDASQPPRTAAEPLDLSPRGDLAPTAPRRALLLTGSPRGQASVSAGIAAHLARLLQERGLEVATESIHQQLRADPQLRGLAAAVEEADVVAMATPLYVDSLPGPVTQALEILSRSRPAGAASGPRWLAIVNSGFPEAVHNDTALAICRLFARQAGLQWIGGLAVGGGGMFAGRPLADQGGRARNIIRALGLTADAIARGRAIPHTAQALARKLPIPAWLYRTIADWGFRQEARRRGTTAHLDDRPYAPPDSA